MQYPNKQQSQLSPSDGNHQPTDLRSPARPRTRRMNKSSEAKGNHTAQSRKVARGAKTWPIQGKEGECGGQVLLRNKQEDSTETFF